MSGLVNSNIGIGQRNEGETGWRALSLLNEPIEPSLRFQISERFLKNILERSCFAKRI